MSRGPLRLLSAGAALVAASLTFVGPCREALVALVGSELASAVESVGTTSRGRRSSILVVTAVPEIARVAVNGVEVGTTPLAVEHPCRAGEVLRVEVAAAAYQTWRRDVACVERGELRLMPRLVHAR
jgi:hypothetical protein